jgi:hypothetical protein
MNSLYPSFFSSVSSDQKNKSGKSSNPIFYARVNDILLSPKTQTQNFFNDGDGWAGLGSIKFTPIGTTPNTGSLSNLIAKPLFNNITKYPLVEEIVLILQAPSLDLNKDPQAQTFYYLTTVGLWNSVHHNAFPEISTYNGGELGFGHTFTEKENVRNLLPEEGDIIFEGRWGNSIRFSSTTKQKDQNNPWSSQGEIGLPITIIRNNQTTVDLNPNPWVPVYEDINFDGSSIYLCAGQDIPLEYASKNLKSFNTTLGSSFNPALQIVDNILTHPDQSPLESDKLK